MITPYIGTRHAIKNSIIYTWANATLVVNCFLPTSSTCLFKSCMTFSLRTTPYFCRHILLFSISSSPRRQERIHGDRQSSRLFKACRSRRGSLSKLSRALRIPHSRTHSRSFQPPEKFESSASKKSSTMQPSEQRRRRISNLPKRVAVSVNANVAF